MHRGESVNEEERKEIDLKNLPAADLAESLKKQLSATIKVMNVSEPDPAVNVKKTDEVAAMIQQYGA